MNPIITLTVCRQDLRKEDNRVVLTCLDTSDPDGSDEHLVFLASQEIAAGLDVGCKLIITVERSDVQY